jgi:glycosyltransferase involved in cell wall biosynthesis
MTASQTTEDGDTISVCYLINKIPPDGAPTVVKNLVEQGQTGNLEFTVCFFGGDDSLRPDLEAADARVVDFGAEGEFPQLDPRALPSMVRFFARETFDILHCHLPASQSVGRILGRLSGIEYVVSTQHNVPANYHTVERAAEFVTRPLDEKTIAVSEGVQSAFTGESELFTPGSDDKWGTIPNGIDVESFAEAVDAADPKAVRDEWGLTVADPLFLNVARYEPQKRQRDIIEAMEHVVDDQTDAHLLVVGWGSLESDLRDEVWDRGLSDAVTITGRVPEIHSYYAAADVFVSASAFEGLPVTLLEAMAAQCPIVATDIYGVREVVTDGETGLLVPPESPRQLARSMNKFENESRRRRFGKRGYQRVQERFALEEMVRRHRSLYRDLVSQ